MTNYPTTKYRIPDEMFKREPTLEQEYGIDNIKLYGYYESDNSVYIVGEIVAKKTPLNSFCMICTIYDKEDDIIETTESKSYGSGLVTSMIRPAAFFDGFPFSFSIYGVSKKKIKEICIYPASSY